MTSDERAVLDANAAFYAAFHARDLAAMEAVWARENPVACAHPGWTPLDGRDRVLRSWRAIFDGGAPEVRCDDARVNVYGGVAVLVCIERLSDVDTTQHGDMVATNVFVRERGVWLLVHHQAGPMAADDDDDVEDEAPQLLN